MLRRGPRPSVTAVGRYVACAGPAESIAAIKAKQGRNEAREWPDWRTADPDAAIEHVR